nr:MAG: polymerase PB2 [Hainan orthomyxo-like virus 2]
MSEYRKELLLKLAQKVNNASDEAINILRGTMACNYRAIERGSKNLKDPSPLQSMLVAITQKFPIAIDYEWAVEHKIPAEYTIGKTKSYMFDKHRSDRILCKLETIQWVIDNITVTEADLKAQALLWKNQRKMVEDFSKIRWTGKVTFGRIDHVRANVRTNVPEVEVPYGLRNTVIKGILLPDRMLPQSPIVKERTEAVKRKIDQLDEVPLKLLSQVNIIRSSMDTKNRTIPILTSLNPILIPHRHAISCHDCVNDYVWMGGEERASAFDENLTLIGNICGSACNDFPDPQSVHSLSKALQLATLDGMKLLELVRGSEAESNGIKILKALLKMPISNEIVYKGIRMSLLSSASTIQYNEVNGVTRAVYPQPETFSFSYKNLRGTFSKSRWIVQAVSVNFTEDYDDLHYLLIRIATYCDCGITQVKGTNKTQVMNRRIEKYCEDNLDELYQAANLLQRLKKGERSVGIIHLTEDSAYQKGTEVESSIHCRNGKVTFNFGRMSIKAVKFRKLLPSGFKCKSFMLLEYWPVIDGLYETISYFACHPNHMMDYYNQNDFESLTAHIKRRIEPQADREAICSTANMLFSRMMHRGIDCDEAKAFLFVFCGPLKEELAIATEFKYATHDISLVMGTSDIVRPGGRCLRIGHRTLVFKQDVRFIAMLLEDYRISKHKGERLPMKSIADLAKNNLRGSYLFSFDNQIYVASHNVLEKELMTRTLQRFDNIFPAEVAPRKRKGDKLEEGESSKRSKVEPVVVEEEAHEFFNDFDDEEELIDLGD